MKDPVALHCPFCDKDVVINEDHVRALVYEARIHLEIECPNCQKVFADYFVVKHNIMIKGTYPQVS